MFIELFGLPASGKTSLRKVVTPLLLQRGFHVETLQVCANQGIERTRSEGRFFRRMETRIGIAGMLGFRATHPELFDYLISAQDALPDLTLWGMDFVTALHFAALERPEGCALIYDEGLAHRGAANLRGTEDPEAYDTYVRHLPRDHVMVHVEISPEESVDRSIADRGRLPGRRWYPGHRPRVLLAKKHALMQRACDIRREMGLPMIELDGRAPHQESAERLVAELPDAFARVGCRFAADPAAAAAAVVAAQ